MLLKDNEDACLVIFAAHKFTDWRNSGLIIRNP